MRTKKPQSIAEKISSLFGDDGRCFITQDNRTLVGMCASYNAKTSYGLMVCAYSNGNVWTIKEVPAIEYWCGEPVRHAFSDGSAIVIVGSAWDIEGSAPFSWRG